MQADILNYSLKDLTESRTLDFEDFIFITELQAKAETFQIKPDYYAFGIIKEGFFELEIDNQLCHFKQDALFIHRPNQLIRGTSISEGLKVFIICFKKKFLEYLNETIFTVKNHSFLSDGIASYIPVEKKDKDNLVSIFERIFDLYKSLPKNNGEWIARSLTSALIYETDAILTKYISQSQVVVHETEKLAHKFKRLVYENFLKQRKVSFYASKLNISINHLYSVVKEHVNKSPSSFIHLQLVNEAKKQLSGSDLSIAEIAYNLNFSDPYSFSKFFKKHAGCSPSHYKQ